jgi:cell division protein ZipA
MTELRWILFGFAIVLLAAIYLWGRRNSEDEPKHESVRARPEPTLYPNETVEREIDEPLQVEQETSWQSDEVRESQASVTLGAGTIDREAQGWRAMDASEETQPAMRAEPDSRRGRVEPRFSDAPVTEELPVAPQAAAEDATNDAAPTLSSGDTPAPRRIERRKILSLRLATAPHKLEGARLLQLFETEGLQHGKYGVYHRLHEDGLSIFSVASMIEPGTFEPEKMPQSQYPGITLFAQLPGPVPGMHALNELVACARRLQQNLGGTLQDERGVPLTVHRVERMRQEVRDFERPSAQTASSRGTSPSHGRRD